METQTHDSKDKIAKRQDWMSVLAKADWPHLEALWQQSNLRPDYQIVRGPEIGLIMARGRMGGSGSSFNLGEVTVTRCTVTATNCEHTGHSYVMGRNKHHAETAAVIDCLLQQHSNQTLIEREIIRPLKMVHDARRQHERSKAAATKVDFFTLVRGEDD